MRHSPERGMTQFLFLRLIHETPMHGYQLMDELNKRGFLQQDRLEAGGVYTILRRMEHRGLITSVWEEQESGPDRRIYTITIEGAEILKEGIETMLSRKTLLDDLATYHRDHFQSKQTEANKK
jgi:DNA-binding PadR family transcriptional regulator